MRIANCLLQCCSAILKLLGPLLSGPEYHTPLLLQNKLCIALHRWFCGVRLNGDWNADSFFNYPLLHFNFNFLHVIFSYLVLPGKFFNECFWKNFLESKLLASKKALIWYVEVILIANYIAATTITSKSNPFPDFSRFDGHYSSFRFCLLISLGLCCVINNRSVYYYSFTYLSGQSCVSLFWISEMYSILRNDSDF